MNKIPVSNLIMGALFACLSGILAGPLGIPVPFFGAYSLNLSFGMLPVMLSGILFGPMMGALTGAVADILKVLISSGGAFMPLFTLSYALIGVIPALLLRKTRTRPVFKQLIGITAITQIICSIGLNSLWLVAVMGLSPAILPMRIIAQIIMIPLNAILIELVLYALRNERIVFTRFS
ncbi:MAG: folate family ECF transporter S component [Christensenellales bacterium]|jgi:ECF transporter S component (folate family)